MPDITFILPHWIYWGGIFAVPVFFMLASRRTAAAESSGGLSLPVAYFFWAISGFMGIHRLYLKSWGAAIFIALFVGVIFCNHEAKQTRNAHSIAKNEAYNAAFDLKRAQEEADADAIEKLQSELAAKTADEEKLSAQLNNWRWTAGAVAAVILCLLILDALLMPWNIRQTRMRMAKNDSPPPLSPPRESIKASHSADGIFARTASKFNALIGEFAAYWTIIAVFVFYYEVVARYVFNSPTIWVHESMFLLFGMQYMLAGGFCLRENAHVRVDVFYLHLSQRAKAVVDLITSIFFFIFTVSLLATGWIFFSDSFAIGQVSHTEWEIPHWPIKFALPLGGALIVLQGIAHVLRNIAVLCGKNNGR